MFLKSCFRYFHKILWKERARKKKNRSETVLSIFFIFTIWAETTFWAAAAAAKLISFLPWWKNQQHCYNFVAPNKILLKTWSWNEAIFKLELKCNIVWSDNINWRLELSICGAVFTLEQQQMDCNKHYKRYFEWQALSLLACMLGVLGKKFNLPTELSNFEQDLLSI